MIFFRGQRVILRSDCLAIIHGLKRGGKFPDDTYNAEILRLQLAAQRFPKGVQFEHVFGHNGHQGNEEADRLAGLVNDFNVNFYLY